jgi:hypothetical protein
MNDRNIEQSVAGNSHVALGVEGLGSLASEQVAVRLTSSELRWKAGRLTISIMGLFRVTGFRVSHKRLEHTDTSTGKKSADLRPVELG